MPARIGNVKDFCCGKMRGCGVKRSLKNRRCLKNSRLLLLACCALSLSSELCVQALNHQSPVTLAVQARRQTAIRCRTECTTELFDAGENSLSSEDSSGTGSAGVAWIQPGSFALKSTPRTMRSLHGSHPVVARQRKRTALVRMDLQLIDPQLVEDIGVLGQALQGWVMVRPAICLRVLRRARS